MSEPIYWHGGQRGLGLNRRILPPSVTRARHTLLETAERAGLPRVARVDRVYVTTRYEAALLYAAVHPSGGWVYRVVPEGDLEIDPDCDEAGLSFAAPRARIVQVVKPHPYDVKAIREAVAHG